MRTKAEIMAWVYKVENVREFYENFDSISEGNRQYECFLSLVQDGTITPDEFDDYGFPEMPKEAGIMSGELKPPVEE